MQQSCQSISPKLWVLACKAWPSVMLCRAGANQRELSSYALYGNALVVLYLFPTLTYFRSHSNWDLTSPLTQLHCLFLLPHLFPSLQPLPSQARKSEILYTEYRCCGLRGSPALGHQMVKPCPEWLQDGIKLREVKVWHTAVFLVLPLNYQRQLSKEQVGDTSDYTVSCVMSTTCPVQTMLS